MVMDYYNFFLFVVIVGSSFLGLIIPSLSVTAFSSSSFSSSSYSKTKTKIPNNSFLTRSFWEISKTSNNHVTTTRTTTIKFRKTASFGQFVVPLYKKCLFMQSYSSSSSNSDVQEEEEKDVINCPKISPATGLPNRFYTWKYNQQIRYQCSEDDTKKITNDKTKKYKKHPVLLIHGLFVNCDHWRKMLTEFSNHESYVLYALDLYGCGYSDKPPADSDMAFRCNGERSRFQCTPASTASNSICHGVRKNAVLGTATGADRFVEQIDLCHPLGSPYNFYTWSDVVRDFVRDVILSSDDNDVINHSDDIQTSKPAVTLVCNSIGTITALQAVLDEFNNFSEQNGDTTTSTNLTRTSMFNGVFVISPNFRELHMAEVPFPAVSMPVVRWIQQLLRSKGQGLFTALAKPETVRQILKEPYARTEAVDDVLVDVLLSPLLTNGASDVLFDTLSYSAGPLPEQQLTDLRQQEQTQNGKLLTPVWVCYGLDDPWTPAPRVERLASSSVSLVQRVVAFPNVGHCPHDEAPELVHPLLREFLDSLHNNNNQ